MDDQLEDVFYRACTAKNMEAAEDLLEVLEKWQKRYSGSYGRERRISSENVDRARKELDRLTRLHGAGPPNSQGR